ncbi:3,4-dihydroxy-2-butanone-4-phosphate synthase [Ahniella affigens]|uniref:3,4-dihydroxy-2-butanone 4-phosphate synthase n=1 Tax=Ahniella affigens TaxID=2021234 RepID=A0A2P1PZF8_9GAMM|nr:3,4-dihydroxy-2-butanone-4-phosphate synthase [Ahniella affigens]AVQ00207.1 3,4-dihydroxy-2-butanone-4-phosphate synthase [Ahniella affigens]
MSAFNTIPELLDDIRAGRMVVILDDEDRENEGDLIMAAELVKPEHINFMAKEARGLICLALTEARCAQLNLPPMVADNRSPHRTAFTVSIEAAEGVSTGISAYDRAHTIRTAVMPNAKAADLTQPGHIFPLTARHGGVLMRAGHTEAAADLALLAGLEPAGVLVEIMRDDGHMARRPELEVFAKQHGLKIGTIADLIRYRLATEQTVERVASESVLTEHGPFELVRYRDRFGGQTHVALVCGRWATDDVVPVRVHHLNVVRDVLKISDRQAGFSASQSLAEIATAGRGVFVLLGERLDSADWFARLNPNADSNAAEAAPAWTTVGVGAQILADLGVHRLRVLGTPRRFSALSGFGLEVVDCNPA